MICTAIRVHSRRQWHLQGAFIAELRYVVPVDGEFAIKRRSASETDPGNGVDKHIGYAQHVQKLARRRVALPDTVAR